MGWERVGCGRGRREIRMIHDYSKYTLLDGCSEHPLALEESNWLVQGCPISAITNLMHIQNMSAQCFVFFLTAGTLS